MVARGNQVSQKTVDIGEGVGASELTQAANFLNSEFAGRPIDEVRDGVRARLREERTLYDQLLALALRLASQTLEDLQGPAAVYIEGAVDAARAGGARPAAFPRPRLRTLLRMVEEKQRLVRLLNDYIDGPGLTVVIGTEHSDPELRPVQPDRVHLLRRRGTGTVGVIGPTRMKYSRAITAVDVAAMAVARVLKDVTRVSSRRTLESS